MEREALIYLVSFQSFHHGVNAAVGFLTFFKAAVNRSFQFLSHFAENLHGSKKHGHMTIMATRMADALYLRNASLFLF